ncbi:MAG: hypothetical protein ACKVRO_06440, partial [Micropepsaceae bacterium]
DVPFSVELNEWDDYNKPDPIGAVDCNIGQVCKFPLGAVTLHDVGSTAGQPQQLPAQTQAGN